MGIFNLYPLNAGPANGGTTDSWVTLASHGWANGTLRNTSAPNDHDHLVGDGWDALAVHPLDHAYPAPEGTLSESEYASRSIAMANHPSAPESPVARKAWCTWYGCETDPAPTRCGLCGDFHPRGVPAPDLRNYA